jgi:hypothetical protein
MPSKKGVWGGREVHRYREVVAAWRPVRPKRRREDGGVRAGRELAIAPVSKLNAPRSNSGVAAFAECAYGFRPKKSATDALEALREAGSRGLNFVVDADSSTEAA